MSARRDFRKREVHGLTRNMTRPPEYNAWHQMISRCRNPNKPRYRDYGARGIDVCERWLSFVAFIEDMGPRPGPDYSLDRIDNDKGYEPGNCRWATRIEQGSNKRNNHLLTHDGRTQSRAAWARETGLCQETIKRRLIRGWTVTEALTTPLGSVLQPSDHGRALTRDQALEIRSLSRAGASDKDLAKRFGVHRATVGKIRRGIVWPDHGHARVVIRDGAIGVAT